MLPHQQRVIEERTELCIKRAKLDQFIFSDFFPFIPLEEQKRMKRQNEIMYNYINILTERIDGWKEDSL